MGWPSSRITSRHNSIASRAFACLFQGFAIGHYRWQLGAGDSEPPFRFGPEMAEISNEGLPT
jgi:hypothetical protein